MTCSRQPITVTGNDLCKMLQKANNLGPECWTTAPPGGNTAKCPGDSFHGIVKNTIKIQLH